MADRITIDASKLGTTGISFGTNKGVDALGAADYLVDYFTDLATATQRYYGGTDAYSGSHMGYLYSDPSRKSISIGGENLSYDKLHYTGLDPHGLEYNHGDMSGKIDSFTLGSLLEGETFPPSGSPSADFLAMFNPGLVISGLDIDVEAGTNFGPTNLVYLLHKVAESHSTANLKLFYDFLSGTAQNFIGSDGDDTYVGTIHDDTIDGRGGNDTIDGGDGIDTVYYDGYYTGSSKTYSYTGGTGGQPLIVTDSRTTDGTGVDSLVNVEYLRFLDLTYDHVNHRVNYVPTDVTIDDAEVEGDAAVGTVVGSLTVVDKLNGGVGGPQADTHTLELVDDAGGLFTIDGTDIKVNGVLTEDSYTVRVKVTDSIGHVLEKDLTITVSDPPPPSTDTTDPVITSNGGDATAAINVAENTTAVTTVVATDASTLVYSISGGSDASLFQIDAATGALTFKTAPNFEQPGDNGANNVYDVVVRATDTAGLFDEQTLAITVTDVNEAPTSLALSKSTVDEDAAVDTVVGTLSASDPEGQALTYTLTDNAGGKFKLVTGSDGKTSLAVASALDYETATSHTVKVKVSDGTNEVEKTFTVQVGDVADGADQSRGTITLDASGSNGIDFDAFLLSGFLKGTTGGGFPTFDNDPAALSGKEAFFSYGDSATSKYVTARGSFGYDMNTHRISGKIETIEYGTRGTGTFNGSGAFTGGNVQLRITGLDLANDGNADANGEVRNFVNAYMAGSSADPAKLSLYLQHLKQFAQNVIGSSGADTYVGTRFNDTVKGNGGNDTVDGGLGEDTLVLNGKKEDYSWTENANGTWTVTDKRSGSNDGVDTIKGIEKLKFSDETVTIGEKEVSDLIEGTSGNDSLPGTNRSDRILGHEGNDQLYGKGGHDVLNGGAGNDALFGGTGNDQLYGGEGNDKLYGGTGNDEAFGGTGNDQLYGGTGKDMLYGGAGKDLLYGGTGNDELYGGEGNDALYGGAGKDEIDGGAGNDQLYGGEGNDVISGGAGNDRIVGGKGADLLSGGAGKDTFVFNAVSDSTLKTNGRDTILDFNGKDGDRIDLSGLDANATASGHQSFAFIGSDAFSGKAGELRFEKTASDTFVYGDVDGDGTADFAILIAGSMTFEKDYFIL